MRFPDLKNKITEIKSGAGISCLLHLLICILFSANTHAQSCTTSQFVKSYESEGTGIGYFLGRLNSGKLYFGGSKNNHLVLHTTDKNGSPTWDKQYQCPEITGYASFAFASMDSSGNYFVSTDGTGIGLLDAGGNVLTSKLMNNMYPGMYCISIGVLQDNKKVLLLRDQMSHGSTNGYAVICLSADLSTIVWTRYFSHYDCSFFTMDVLNNKVFVPGAVDQVGTLLCFDGASGNLLSTNSYNNGYNRTFFDKIFKYNGGYIVLGGRWVSSDRPYTLIMRLDDNLDVINSYLLNEVWQNALPTLAVESDGSYHCAWGDETSAGSYSFFMSKNDGTIWSIFNGSINYRPKVYLNTPEGLTLLSFGFQVSGGPGPKASLLLWRTDWEGKLLNCPPTDFPLTTSSVNYTKSVSPMKPIDTSYITMMPTPMLVSDDTYNLIEVCKNVSTCDTVSIIGNTDLCNLATAPFIARRNKECADPVTWTIDNDSTIQTKLNDSTISIQFPGPGNYTLSATLSGCKLLSDTVQIHIRSSGNVLDLGPDTTICPGNTILLNARKGFASYLWQNGVTDSIFTVTQPGKYFVTAIDGCGGMFSDTVIVSQHPPIPFDAGPDRVKCNNDTIQLHATPGFLNYEWLPEYYLDATASSDVTASPLTDTVYTVKAEKTPGCFAYDTVHVKVNQSMVIDFGGDTSLCSGDSVILNAGNHFSSYTWSNGSVASFIAVKTAGAYFVDAISANGCHSFDTMEVIKVFANPVVALDHNNNLCAGDTRLLDAGNFISYLWNNGSTGKSLLVSEPGTYYVTVTDDKNCKANDTTFITNLLSKPSDFLPTDTAICSYATLVLNSKSGFVNYLWNNNATTSSITIDKQGTYWLQATDDNGCVGKEFVTVSLKDCMQGFYVPNAFTPNNDGRNDLFKPMIFGNVVHYSLVIYNRFGQKVFESTDLTRGWDGNFHSRNSPGDIFIWSCVYQFAGGNVENKKGTVTLVR
jgi:gliding motility-associated-like protein